MKQTMKNGNRAWSLGMGVAFLAMVQTASVGADPAASAAEVAPAVAVDAAMTEWANGLCDVIGEGARLLT